MKKLFLSILLVGNLSYAKVAAYCTEDVNKAVASVYDSGKMPKSIDSIVTSALNYAGFHLKKYQSEIHSNDKIIKFESVVFEYETEFTDCEIQSVKRIF